MGTVVDGKWIPLSGTVLNSSKSQVTVKINHLSIYGVFVAAAEE